MDDFTQKLVQRAALIAKLPTLNYDAADNRAIIALYIALRTQIEQVEADTIAPLKQAMGDLEVAMGAKLEAAGEQSSSTTAGTAFFETTDSVTCQDPDALFNFVRDNEAWDLIEKRASKTGVKAFMEERKEMPPGVKYATFRKVKFNRPRAK